MELILKLLYNALEGIVYGVILLIVAAVLLPEKVFLKILKKLKPDITSKSVILSKLRLIFDYIFNNKEIIIEDEASGASRSLQAEIIDLMREKRILEGNLFFLDLLKNLTSMLLFSLTQSGYNDSAACEILNRSMEYLLYYGRQLRKSNTSRNVAERVSMAAERFQAQVEDTASFLQKERGEQQLESAKFSLQQGTAMFDTFMKKEFESTKENLRNINQILSDKFILFLKESA